jgi:hypothetical protein
VLMGNNQLSLKIRLYPLFPPMLQASVALLDSHSSDSPKAPVKPISKALNPPPLVSAQPKPILSLEGHCFRCLSTTHYMKECREPLRCKACLRYGHSSDSCLSTPIPHSIVLNPDSNPSPLGAKVMEFNTDLLAALDWHDEEITAPPILHHPLFGASPYPPPLELVFTGPIDYTAFEQPHNMDDIFAGAEDVGEVTLPIVDKQSFKNITLAHIHPATNTPTPFICAAISSELSTSHFRLVLCSQANALIIFRTPTMCFNAINTQFELEREGTSYSINLAPHDMTDNCIFLDKGYLVNIEVTDFPIEYWCKEHISAAFYPFGFVVIIERLSLSSGDFQPSLCVLTSKTLGCLGESCSMQG